MIQSGHRTGPPVAIGDRMLLRHVIEHFRAQNWTAIAIDFVIVVVGVVLGFQITAWNEQRSDRALEAEYLQRIGDELRDDRVVLESIIRNANESRLFALDLSEFFDGRMAADDHQRLVVAIYKFGLDPIDLRFDVSTFDDLVSTGRLRLISDPEIRQAIQRAYARLQSLAPARDPYREEYSVALRGWIPSSVIQQIRPACLEASAYSACSDLHLDDEAVRSIVEQIDTREARLAFQSREVGLATLSGIGGSILIVLDETLAKLEQ